MTQIVSHDHDFGREQAIRAAFVPLDTLTDWDAVIAGAAQINPEALIAELRAGEPYDKNEANELKVWRTNQHIRIAHRYRKGLPQYGAMTCGSCGARKVNPASGGHSATEECLYCRELEHLTPGDSWYDRPYFVAYDSISGTWGIAWKREDGQSSRTACKQAAIIVCGYKTSFEASVAAMAPARFTQIYDRTTKPGQGVFVDDVVDSGELFRLNLPLSPEGWEAYLRQQMTRVSPKETEPYESALNDAAGKFFTKDD